VPVSASRRSKQSCPIGAAGALTGGVVAVEENERRGVGVEVAGREGDLLGQGSRLGAGKAGKVAELVTAPLLSPAHGPGGGDWTGGRVWMWAAARPRHAHPTASSSIPGCSPHSRQPLLGGGRALASGCWQLAVAGCLGLGLWRRGRCRVRAAVGPHMGLMSDVNRHGAVIV
jgi:hypothetical protein